MELENLKGTDVYLIDQILKGRYQPNESILDAGCGSGRNLKWFSTQNYDLFAVDVNEEVVSETSKEYPKVIFKVSELSKLPYNDNSFDHIICSAVLHFAKDASHFLKMIKELSRVLKPKGSLFIRMTTDVGVEHTAKYIKDGVYLLKDETERFLITKELLNKVLNDYSLELIEPFKTTVVEDLRSMSTIVLQKKQS